MVKSNKPVKGNRFYESLAQICWLVQRKGHVLPASTLSFLPAYLGLAPISSIVSLLSFYHFVTFLFCPVMTVPIKIYL